MTLLASAISNLTNRWGEHVSVIERDRNAEEELWTVWPGFGSRQGEEILFITTVPSPVAGPTQPRIHGIYQGIF
jgi:hypothetical protein